jgi:DNA replication protein DnaC
MTKVSDLLKQLMAEVKVEDVLPPVEELTKIEQEVSLQQKFKNFDWKFETFEDPTLIKMLEYAQQFVLGLEGAPHWITFSGPTEIGKTYLLQRIYELTKGVNIKFTNKPFGAKNVIYKKWYDLTRDLFKKDGVDRFSEIEECGLLIIEEFLCDNLQSVNARDVIILDYAHQLLNSRLGKHTILDTNKTLEEIANLDVRIASRLKRGGSDFVSINKNTKLYSQREPCI